MKTTAHAKEDAASTHVLAQFASLLRSGDVQAALALTETASENSAKPDVAAPEGAEADVVGRIASPPLDTLSFIERRQSGGGYNYWANVPAASSYAEECEIGGRLAEEFLTFIGKYHNNGNGALLGPIVIDMDKNGAGRGHKIGFMNTISKYAMGAAYLLHAENHAPEHPWNKCRRLGRELAEALESTGEQQFAYIAPKGSGTPTLLFGHLDYHPSRETLNATPDIRGTPQQGQDFSELFYELINLAELAEATLDILREMDYTHGDGSRNAELDRVVALQRVLCTNLGRLRESAEVLDGPKTWVPASSA
ncbi:hypothetical protein ELH93_22175 [Rhizobium leguminosarum]|uniref:Uncharacterized protein n=1 Tax=Rhizobium leguminosarum TaxID=384 RepID=A0ABD7PX16_RHILE|nr:hypothetical protein [Rhizobium leguminosarum]TAW32048.1 hypothetical protein ELI19_22175 [Rhizobium leguminosarum]TAW45779.1 hypothetical protein ELI18_22145 [Rhizobium leguminosarum]TAY35159.1 hypothetical protein ELH93_22175 [Rhizobium leguminosarum]